VLRRILLSITAAIVLLLVIVGGGAYWFFARDGFRRALESQATSWLGHPVRIGAARAQLLPRLAVELRDIRVGEPVQLTLGEVDLASDLRPLFSGRIENADVSVSGSRIDLPLPFAMPKGSSGDTAAPPSASDPPVRVVSVRSITLRSVGLRSRGREVRVSADLAYGATALAVSKFTAESGATTLDAEGVVTLSPRVDALLNATANRLDLDELLALSDAFATRTTPPGTPTAVGRPPRIVVNISAREATAGRVQVHHLLTTLVRDGASVTLKPSQFEVFGGRYAGSISARLGSEMSATLEARVENIDVAQLAAFGGAPDSITGTLSGTGKFTGTGADVAQLVHSVRGSGAATIVDGSIKRLHLVRTVILFFGRPAPDAGEGTDRFDRLAARFSLANRVLNAEAFELHSTDADVVGTGTLNLDSEALDGRGDVTLSEALSKQAGTDLYRYAREGNRVVLPANLGGTLTMPRLTIDVGAAAKRGLKNEVERRIKGIFDGLKR